MPQKLKPFVWAIIALLFIAGSFLIFATLTNYRPPEKLIISHSDTPGLLKMNKAYSIFNWNIGYAGLSSEMDFFYDGGKSVRTDRMIQDRNQREITNILQAFDTVDFILLQEVDIKSKRSYQINQLEYFANRLTGFTPLFGLNYKVPFVPVPVTSPMGNVQTGLAVFSGKVPSEALRCSLPGNYSWPMHLFMPDRCFLVCRYPLESGNEFILINIHNSAYDDGTLRQQQLAYLKEFLETEYQNGNQVLACGDWNQCPPDFQPAYANDLFDTINKMDIPGAYAFDNWNFYYDTSIPTNRRVDIPYNKGTTLTTTIDFCLASPGVAVTNFRVLDEQFRYSDHNPLYISFEIIN